MEAQHNTIRLRPSRLSQPLSKARKPSLHNSWYVQAMERLVGIVQDISQARDMDTITRIVRDAARGVTGADGATFILRSGDHCCYMDESAISPLWKGRRFPASSCISGWVMEHGQHVAITDITKDPRVPPDFYKETFVKSMAMVPIRRHSPIGAIGNYWATRHESTPEEISILQVLADTASVALQNVHLLNENEHCRLMVRGIKDYAICMTDPDGNITSWNPGAEVQSGYASGEIIGRHVAVFYPEEAAAEGAPQREFNLAAAQGAYEHANWRMRKNGTRYWANILVTPLRNERGDLRGYSIITSDLTETRRAERAARENEELFRLAIEASPNAMIMADHTGKIMMVSSQTERLFGYKKEELIGRSIEHLVPRHFRLKNAKQRRTFMEMLEARAVGEGLDLYARRKDGSEFPIEVGLNPIKTKEGTFVLSAVVDLTARKQTEAALKESVEKADAANRAKSEFLANMSHEIRTPMNAVVGLSHILAKSKPMTPKQLEYIKTLQMSAQSLMSLLNDLLDIAKIESETIQLDNSIFNLKHLVETVARIVRVKAQEKNVEVKVDFDPALGGDFVGDVNRIRQVILNLLSNAVKFTTKGSVTIRVTAHPSRKTQRMDARIEIIDTGIGIPAEKLETIFNKFSQADSSITRKFGGTGLGLAITKMLVELMGGAVAVESRVGEGSTFRVELPLAKPSDIEALQHAYSKKGEEHRMSAALVAEGAQSPIILLVEDYQPNILVAGTILEQMGFRYDVAVNGQEAVDKVKAQLIDLVLMDVQMPVLDGYSATKLIRDHEKENDLPPVPIVGVTAHALGGDRERCLTAGMNEYISKPFNPDQLKEKIMALTKSGERSQAEEQ